MKSFCEVLQGAYLKEEGWQQNWNKLVAPRILAFCRLARLQKIPTVDKLKKRRHVLMRMGVFCALLIKKQLLICWFIVVF